MLTIYSDDYFMKKALDEAQVAYDNDEVPVGAVIVCNNMIIANEINLICTFTSLKLKRF